MPPDDDPADPGEDTTPGTKPHYSSVPLPTPSHPVREPADVTFPVRRIFAAQMSTKPPACSACDVPAASHQVTILRDTYLCRACLLQFKCLACADMAPAIDRLESVLGRIRARLRRR